MDSLLLNSHFKLFKNSKLAENDKREKVAVIVIVRFSVKFKF